LENKFPIESSGERIFVLFDIPGVGKSSLIYHISIQNNCYYLKIHAKSDILKHFIDFNLSGYVTENQLTNYLKICILRSLNCVIKYIWDIISNSNNLNDEINREFIIFNGSFKIKKDYSDSVSSKFQGLNIDNFEDIKKILKNSIENLQTEILKKTKKDKFVIHFEECDGLSVSNKFKRIECKKRDTTKFKVTNEIMNNYLLISISSICYDLSSFDIKIAFTGTNSLTSRIIIIDSGTKSFIHSTMSQLNFGIISKILKHYTNITDNILEQNKEVFLKLNGPFRNIQWFLFSLSKKKNINVKDLENFIDEEVFKLYYINTCIKSDFDNLIHSLNKLLFLFCFNSISKVFIENKDKSIKIENFDSKMIDLDIFELSRQGFCQIIYDDNNLTILQPFYFMCKLWQTVFSCLRKYSSKRTNFGL
jgi:hypothetical protein